jgi:hypothetical protein
VTAVPPGRPTDEHTDQHAVQGAGQHTVQSVARLPGSRAAQPRPESAGAEPAQDPAADPYRPTPRNPPRWVRWTVVPLLVLVPIGYVLISAEQSRDSGVNKQKEAAISHLSLAMPTSLQQRIYQVPFPYGARYPGYLETNSWDTSVLYAQFTTTSGGLDTFLAKIGTSRYALRPGTSAITAAQMKTAGWIFPPGHRQAGIALHQVGDKPDHDIVVDLSDPDLPIVYVVSTVNFQHGFGRG